jgi:dTDP-4-dehydrorhamnose reductase
MKVIIFGSNGMLGNYLKTYLNDKYEVVALTRDDWDLTNIEEYGFRVFIYNLPISKGDVIINAAGIIKQRDSNPLDMIMVNSVFPHLLADIKEKYKCEVIHISTDCVFSGNRGNYNENDSHDCEDEYGKTKSLGENPKLTTIRTSIIGEELDNKKSLLEWVKSNKGKTISGYKNHTWNGVTCLELTKLINNIIENKTFWEGVRHVHSPYSTNKAWLIKLISHVFDLDIIVNEVNMKTDVHRNLTTTYHNKIETILKTQLIELKNYNINDRNS